MNTIKRILLVDDDAPILHITKRGLMNASQDCQIETADNGAKALELLSQRHFDVVVSDLMMPRMDGVELLTRVMQKHPDTVRIVVSGQAEWRNCLRSIGPAHQYLAKPCEPRELLEQINRSLAMRERLSNGRLKRLVTQLHALPSLPSLYFKLLEHLRCAEPSALKIGQIIEQDVSMCLKMLQLVNSAFFGLARRISSPAEAVIYLGVETVQSLVLSLQVFALFERVKISGFSFEDLWMHSWMTAIFARRIATLESQDRALSDQAFSGGLLHDIGKLVLTTGFPNRYQQVLTLLRESPAKTDMDAEREVFGASHEDVGAYLLALWGLPDAIVEAVAFHHHPDQSPRQGFGPVAAVHAGNSLAHDLHKTTMSMGDGHQINEPFFQELGLLDHLAAWRTAVAESSTPSNE